MEGQPRLSSCRTAGRSRLSGVYVFWFVADGEETPSHFQMMKRLALHLLRTGVLQRWAYVSLFSPRASRGRKTPRLRAWKN